MRDKMKKISKTREVGAKMPTHVYLYEVVGCVSGKDTLRFVLDPDDIEGDVRVGVYMLDHEGSTYINVTNTTLPV